MARNLGYKKAIKIDFSCLKRWLLAVQLKAVYRHFGATKMKYEQQLRCFPAWNILTCPTAKVINIYRMYTADLPVAKIVLMP